VVPLSPLAAQQAGVASRLYVGRVVAGGPADGAGLRVGDVITQIDGAAATSSDHLLGLTLTRRAGDKVRLTYERAGETHTTTLTLGEQPE
jgi:putative serine protease PepD